MAKTMSQSQRRRQNEIHQESEEEEDVNPFHEEIVGGGDPNTSTQEEIE